MKFIADIGLFIMAILVMAFSFQNTTAQRPPRQNTPVPLPTAGLTPSATIDISRPSAQLPMINTDFLKSTREALIQSQPTLIPTVYSTLPSCTPLPANVYPTATREISYTSRQIEIKNPQNMGTDREQLTLVNKGANTNIAGWTLSKGTLIVYTFSERIFFSSAEIILYTRSGADTPVVAYIDSENPVWQIGDIVTLKDAEGDVIATYAIGEAGDLCIMRQPMQQLAHLT